MIEPELLALIDSCYYPGYYAEGEELCLEALEADPDCQQALMHLCLYLAAQNQVRAALEVARQLAPEQIVPALRRMAFGSGSEAEAIVYSFLLERGREEGREQELDRFLSTPEEPPTAPEDLLKKARARLESQGADLTTTFLLDLKRHHLLYQLDPQWEDEDGDED